MSVENKKVSEVMNRTLFTVAEEATIGEIIDTMLKNRISAVIVVAGNGEFLGIVSKTDIIDALKKYGAEIFNKKAEDLLCPKPYTIEGEATIKEAAQRMLAHGVHRLLVINPTGLGKYVPVGIITATDILKALAI
ncbi:MAG: CBS domain-containing protein [Caldimicrobium sp.]